MPERRANDSLSFFLLLAGYLLFVIAALMILRVVVFDYWLGTGSPPQLTTFSLLGLPLCMIVAGHVMRRKRAGGANTLSGK
jgi:hypothetical protein